MPPLSWLHLLVLVDRFFTPDARPRTAADAGREPGSRAPLCLSFPQSTLCHVSQRRRPGRGDSQQRRGCDSSPLWGGGQEATVLTLEEGLRPRDRSAQGRGHRIDAPLQAGHAQVPDGFGAKAVLDGNKNSGFGLEFLSLKNEVRQCYGGGVGL